MFTTEMWFVLVQERYCWKSHHRLLLSWCCSSPGYPELHNLLTACASFNYFVWFFCWATIFWIFFWQFIALGSLLFTYYTSFLLVPSTTKKLDSICPEPFVLSFKNDFRFYAFPTLKPQPFWINTLIDGIWPQGLSHAPSLEWSMILINNMANWHVRFLWALSRHQT